MFRLKLVILSTLLVICHTNQTLGAVHQDPVMRYGLGTLADCDVAEDGSVYATAGGIGVVVWNAKTNERVRILSAPQHLANAVAVSPDGTRIASGEGYFSGRILIWDAKTGQILHELTQQTYTITSLDFSPDGTKLLSAARDNTLVLYDVETGGLSHFYEPFAEDESGENRETYPATVSFAPNGNRFVTSSWGAQQMRVYDIDQSEPILTYDGPAGIGCVEFSPSGTQVAGTLAAGDALCFIYDIATEKVEHMLAGHTYNPETIHYSPDGKRLVSAAGDSMVIIWDAQTGTRLNTFEGHDGENKFAVYLKSGKVLSGDRAGNLLKWDPYTLEILYASHDYQDGVRGMDVAGWDSTIATGAGSVSRTWIEKDGTLIQASSIGLEYASNVAFVDEERILVGGNGHVYLKNHNTGELLKTYNINTLSEGLEVSPDGLTFLVSGEYTNTPELWRISGTKVRNVTGNTAKVKDAVFSPDGAWIATSALDGSVIVSDINSGLEVQKLTLTNAAWDVEFSPDNQYLAAVGPRTDLTVWKTSDWSVKLYHSPGSGRTLAFSPDSKKIALGYQKYTDNHDTYLVDLMNIETKTVEKQYMGHTGSINDLCFSPNGRRLYSAGNDGLVLAWPTGAARLRLYDKLLIVNTADPVHHADIAAQTLALSENIYWVAQLRGFRQENINFLSTQDALTTGTIANGPPSADAIATALGSGADNAMRLYIWLIGPGVVDGPEPGLFLSSEGTATTTLTPTRLKALLDVQQEGDTPLSDVILFVDCDGAGAFVEGCAHDTNPTRRLVMASTQADGVANFGDNPNSIGVSFTDMMLPELLNGHTIYVAYQKAVKNLERLNWPIDHPQTPLFDDDGDGLLTSLDGSVARYTVFGNRPSLNIDLLDGAKTNDHEVVIELTGQASLSVEVPLPEGVDTTKVEACLMPLDPDAPDQSIRRVPLEPQASQHMTNTTGTSVSQLYRVGLDASSLPSGKYQVYYSISRTDGYGVTLKNSADYIDTSSMVKYWQSYR